MSFQIVTALSNTLKLTCLVCLLTSLWTQLKGGMVIKYLVVQMVSLVKLFGLAFQQQMFDLSRSASWHANPYLSVVNI